MLLKLKNGKLAITKICFFLKKKDADIDNILISNKIFSNEKNYKYFIDYMDDDYKINPLFIMLSKTSAYVKGYSDKTK